MMGSGGAETIYRRPRDAPSRSFLTRQVMPLAVDAARFAAGLKRTPSQQLSG